MQCQPGFLSARSEIFFVANQPLPINFSYTGVRSFASPTQIISLVGSPVSEFASSLPESETATESSRGFREGLPAAFRMRADAHYVEQLDGGATPAMTVQFIAVHSIDVSDSPADALPTLVESIKRHGVLEPLVVQRNNGTYKTIAGQKRLAAARAAGLRDVPCLVHPVSDDRAEALRELLKPPTTRAPQFAPIDAGITGTPGMTTAASILNVALAAMRLVAAVPDGQVAVVKTVAGARLSIDLPFEI